MKIPLLFLASMLLTAPAVRALDETEAATEAAEGVIERYGAGHIDSVSALKFTFSVQHGTTTLARSWTWDRAAGRVTVQTMDGKRPLTLTYEQNRLEIGDRAANEKADRWFVNDSFWLLFPVHLETDPGLELSSDDEATMPIGRGRAERLSVQYPARGGYTPGDGYDLFVGDDGLIHEWVYRRGGTTNPTMATTWEEHAQLGPLVVSLRRRDGKGGLDIRFTEVAAKFRGSEAWIAAKPL